MNNYSTVHVYLYFKLSQGDCRIYKSKDMNISAFFHIVTFSPMVSSGLLFSAILYNTAANLK